jgi:hypothetical protein
MDVKPLATATVSPGVKVDIGAVPLDVKILQIARGHPKDDCQFALVHFPNGENKNFQVFDNVDFNTSLLNQIKAFFTNRFGKVVSIPAVQGNLDGATLTFTEAA